MPPGAPRLRGRATDGAQPRDGSVEGRRRSAAARAGRELVGAFVRQFVEVEATDDQGGEGQDGEEGFQDALPKWARPL